MPHLAASDIRAFIPARDFALSKRFYGALGWEARDVGPRLALVDVDVDVDVDVGREQHFYIQDHYLKEVAENSMLHVTVENAADWHAHVAAVLRDGEFPGARVQAPSRQSYGATAVFVHDPSGVLIHFCQWER